MWVRVVKALYGSDDVCSSLTPRRAWSGPWNNIIHMVANICDRGIDIQALCPIMVGVRILLPFVVITGRVSCPLQSLFIGYMCCITKKLAFFRN